MKIPALLWEWPAALFAHGFVVLAVWIASYFGGPSEPLFKPEDVLVVSMSGPPKSDSRMVQKAERAPDAMRGAAKPTADVPPPNPSDMAFKTPEAQVTKGQQDAAMQKIMDDLRREKLVHDLSAPLGTVDRAASDPTGSGDGSTATSGLNDPETAKWIQKMKEKVSPNWHPLISTCQANPKLVVIINVPVNADGSLSADPFVGTSSGNPSLDQSAMRAVQQTTNLPAPPAKFAGQAVVGNTTFRCSEVL